MIIKKTDEKIVCDVEGCGELGKYEVVTSSGAVYFVCEKCMDELKNAVKGIK